MNHDDRGALPLIEVVQPPHVQVQVTPFERVFASIDPLLIVHLFSLPASFRTFSGRFSTRDSSIDLIQDMAGWELLAKSNPSNRTHNVSLSKSSNHRLPSRNRFLYAWQLQGSLMCFFRVPDFRYPDSSFVRRVSRNRVQSAAGHLFGSVQQYLD
jgi:hypothetical protein